MTLVNQHLIGRALSKYQYYNTCAIRAAKHKTVVMELAVDQEDG